jgi:hypothetical protein
MSSEAECVIVCAIVFIANYLGHIAQALEIIAKHIK